MTDAELDQKLRAMSVELAESSPIAPTYEDLHERAGIAVTQVEVTPGPRPDEKSRRPGLWQKTLGVLGLGVAVGGGAFALAALTEDDGANTPQAAVEEFIEAVAAEDAIGVGETLVPSERALVLDHLDPILAELQRLDVAGEEADPRDVSGLEFSADLDSLRMQESPLSDSVTRVRILDGDLGLDADYGAVAMGGLVRDNVDGPLKDPDPVDLLVDVFGGQADVVVVEDSDGWHVSVFYTLAEYLRADIGLPSAGLGAGPTPVGAESPEALMAAVIDGVVAGDFATLLTLADPVEGAVLYDYWPVFQPHWAESMAGVLADGPWADVRSYETAVTGEGAERVVSLISWDYGYTFERTDEQGPLSSFDGTCFVTTYGIDSDGLDAGEELIPQAEGCLGETVELEGDETMMPLRSGLTDVAVVERDGRWYVRPGATLIESWRANTALIDGTASVSPFDLLLRAYPSPPTWGFGLDQLSVGMIISEESGASVAGGSTPISGPCADPVGGEAMATCFSEIYGAQVTAEDVAGCEAQFEGPADSDEITRYEATQVCIIELLFPPTPRDLFLEELANCPGGANPDAGEATPEEQQALIECGRSIFEGDNVPEEILTGMAACLGIDPDALASVTDNQALVTCGVEVVSGAWGNDADAPDPVDEDALVEDVVDQTIVINDGE